MRLRFQMDSEPRWPSPDSRGVCRRKMNDAKSIFPGTTYSPQSQPSHCPGVTGRNWTPEGSRGQRLLLITGADPGLSPLAGIIPYISCCLLCLPQPQASGGSNTIYPYMRPFNRPFNQKVTTQVQHLELWSRDRAFAQQGQGPGFSTQHQKPMKTTTQAHLDLEGQ